jgi:hypothetical protein
MDITKCRGEGCKAKHICYRYTAQPKGEMQFYFSEPPFKIDKGLFKCDMFWGEASELLLEKLKNIMNGSSNKKA